MKFTCDSCGAQYMISDEKVGPSGVKVRCKKCSNVVHVRRAEDVPSPTAAPEAPAPTGGGLDAELGQAFDSAFGEPPAPAPAEAGADLGATQALAPEDAAKIAAAQAAGSAAAAPAATEWYVAIGQAQVGPLPLAEVKRKWEAGDVGPDSLVWRPGMGDWQPLSAVAELANYLAPIPRAAPQPARSEPQPSRPEPQAAKERRSATPAPSPAAGADVSWKPAGASALAALASEEIASRAAATEAKPAAKGPATPSGVKSLVEGLPDGGGVDPTGAIPLTIKGLEITGEKKIERRSAVASRAQEARHRRSLTRVIVIAVVVVLAAVGGAAAFVMTQMRKEPVAVAPAAPAPAPAVAPAPPAPAPAAAPAPAPAAPPPAAVAAAVPPAPAPAPAAAPAAPPPPAPEPPAAKPAPEPPKVAKKEPPAKVGKHGKPPKAEPPPRVAKAEPAARPPSPAPAPAKKKDSLLDFDSSDAALDEALGGEKKGSGRSVYVPPARGGAGALPDKLSAAQINEAVAGQIDALRKCVSDQKSRDPGASGVLKMKWVIGGDGSVRSVQSLPGDYASGPFSSCITGVVRRIQFPKSSTTGQEVTFPFSF
jgi:predicted Zn finger-like uncharacterized protein